MTEQHPWGLINGIQNLLAARNLLGAKKLVEQLLLIAPELPLAWDCAVRVYAPLGDIERAHYFGRRFVDQDSENYRGYELLAYVGLVSQSFPASATGDLTWNKGLRSRLEFVEEMARQSLSHNPNNPWSLSYLGRVQLLKGETHTAIETAETGLAMNPRHIRLLLIRAEALYLQRRLGSSQRTLAQALEIDPNNVDVQSLMANVQLARRNPSKALEHVSTAVAQAPYRERLRDLYWETSTHRIAPLAWLTGVERSLRDAQPFAVSAVVVSIVLLSTGQHWGESISFGMLSVAVPAILIWPALPWVVHLMHWACSRDYRRSGRGNPLDVVAFGSLACLFALVVASIMSASTAAVFAIETIQVSVLLLGFRAIHARSLTLRLVVILAMLLYLASTNFWITQQGEEMILTGYALSAVCIWSRVLSGQSSQECKQQN